MKAIIYIDAANYHYYLIKKGWRIDWNRFRMYFEKLYTVVDIYYYEGVPSKGQYMDSNPGASLDDFISAKKAKQNYLKSLKELGFIVRSKPVGRVYDSSEGRFKHKCNFDVELTIDAIDNLDSFESFILCSGDGDFLKLLKYLKGKWKKTVVVAPSERLSHQLENTANQVIYLEDIRDKIEESRK